MREQYTEWYDCFWRKACQVCGSDGARRRSAPLTDDDANLETAGTDEVDDLSTKKREAPSGTAGGENGDGIKSSDDKMRSRKRRGLPLSILGVDGVLPPEDR